MIATTPRTGSTWLCRRLTERGLGIPGEQLHWLIHGEPELWPASLTGLWQLHCRNNIYGVKAFMYFPDELGLTPNDILPPGPRTFIYLTRDDLDEQACSYAIATLHGGWEGHSNRHLSLPREALVEARRQIHQQSALWERWFDTFSIEPLHITYEQQCADPDKVDDLIECHVRRG